MKDRKRQLHASTYIGKDPDSFCRYCGGSHTRDEHQDIKEMESECEIQPEGTTDVLWARAMREGRRCQSDEDSRAFCLLVDIIDNQAEQIKSLEAAIREQLPTTMMACPKCNKYGVKPRDADKGCLRCQIKAKDEALFRIKAWAEAYPIGIFPELTEGQRETVRQWLKEGGLTLDAVSASNMRHVLGGVKEIVIQALEGVSC